MRRVVKGFLRMVGRIVRGMAEEKWKFFEKHLQNTQTGYIV